MPPKICPSDKIINPKTQRCVSKTGKIGKQLLNKKSKIPLSMKTTQQFKQSSDLTMDQIDFLNTLAPFYTYSSNHFGYLYDVIIDYEVNYSSNPENMKLPENIQLLKLIKILGLYKPRIHQFNERFYNQMVDKIDKKLEEKVSSKPLLLLFNSNLRVTIQRDDKLRLGDILNATRIFASDNDGWIKFFKLI